MLTGEQFDRTRRLALRLADSERMAALILLGKNAIFSLCQMFANGVARSKSSTPRLKVPSL